MGEAMSKEVHMQITWEGGGGHFVKLFVQYVSWETHPEQSQATQLTNYQFLIPVDLFYRNLPRQHFSFTMGAAETRCHSKMFHDAMLCSHLLTESMPLCR